MNGKILTPFRIIENGALTLEDGKITQIFEGEPNIDVSNYRCIDAKKLYISPGFIDMHVHGGDYAEVSHGTVQSIQKLCAIHARFGTTSIVPTVSTEPLKKMYASIDAVKETKLNHETKAAILGVHIEGPYFSFKEKGAQNPEFLLQPDPKDYYKILDRWDGIKMMGASPELPGALALGRELRDRGILACITHSDANYGEVIKALENGYTHITHFYSGCSIVHRENAYRIAGVVESGYLLDELTVEVIADGKHLPPSLLKLIYKVKGANRIALITDGIAYAGVPMKDNQVVRHGDGRELILEDGVMKLSDRSNFAGSIATTNLLVRNIINLADVPLLQAVEMASYTPARILNISHKKGTLSVGKDADILIFDDDVNIKMTMVEGNIVHEEPI